MLIVGENEVKKKKYQLKDMNTGKQEELSINEIVGKLGTQNSKVKT